MYFSLLTVSALAAIANACAAPENKDSPFASVYSAVFLKNILGTVVFWSLDGDVSVGVAITGLPSSGGPFTYRIHNSADPLGGCDDHSKTLNPYCGTPDAPTAAEKEVGDLSGKHRVITGTSIASTYEDKYLSLNKKNKAFVGNLAIVIENAQGKRVACADIEDLLAPLTGEKAEAAKPALALSLPKQVKDLLV